MGEISGGWGNSGLPFDITRGSSVAQTIYLESEIGVFGKITQLNYYLNGSGNLPEDTEIALYLAPTERTAFSMAIWNDIYLPISQFTKVYEGEIGWNQIPAEHTHQPYFDSSQSHLHILL